MCICARWIDSVLVEVADGVLPQSAFQRATGYAAGLGRVWYGLQHYAAMACSIVMSEVPNKVYAWRVPVSSSITVAVLCCFWLVKACGLIFLSAPCQCSPVIGRRL